MLLQGGNLLALLNFNLCQPAKLIKTSQSTSRHCLTAFKMQQKIISQIKA